VRAEATQIVVPDSYPTIQEAINNAVDGDTILVEAGTYHEHVLVNKTVTIIGAGADTTIIDGNSTGHVVHVVSDNVTLSGFTVQSSGHLDWPALDAGICVNGTNACTIAENRLVDIGFAGISLLSCDRTTVRRNNVTGAGWTGIHLMDSSHNIVADNRLTSNLYAGINGHAASHGNNITANVIANSSYGMFYHNAQYNRLCRNHLTNIAVEGIQLQDSVSNNLVAENHLTNCSVGIQLLGPNHGNTLAGNILTDGHSGIRLQSAGHTQIYNNTITHFYGAEWDAAIRLDASGYSNIHSNRIQDNWRGILLNTNSPYVVIYRNNLTENEYAVRVASGGSSFLNITENRVVSNRGYGIGVTGFSSGSHSVTIARNLIMNNSDGIALGQYSNYNRIFQNNITQNGYGFYIEYSTLNTIWGNTVVDNEQQVHLASSPVNTWDAGYPAGGNYWSPFNGTDVAGGPYQNETGRDGIGDAGYGVNS
jgi:parallel beta-helix repeat protein